MLILLAASVSFGELNNNIMAIVIRIVYSLMLGLKINSGAVQISHGPVTVPNATLGGRAEFECKVSGTSEHPSWNINGQNYQTVYLPFGHSYDRNNYILVVSPVQQYMNNSVYYCLFVCFINGNFITIRSDSARLIIKQNASKFTNMNNNNNSNL